MERSDANRKYTHKTAARGRYASKGCLVCFPIVPGCSMYRLLPGGGLQLCSRAAQQWHRCRISLDYSSLCAVIVRGLLCLPPFDLYLSAQLSYQERETYHSAQSRCYDNHHSDVCDRAWVIAIYHPLNDRHVHHLRRISQAAGR